MRLEVLAHNITCMHVLCDIPEEPILFLAI